MQLKLLLLLRNPLYYTSRAIRKLDNRLTLFFMQRVPAVFRARKRRLGAGRLYFITENIGDTVRAIPVLNFVRTDDWIVCTKFNFAIVGLLDHKNVIVLNRDPGFFDFIKVMRYLRRLSFLSVFVLDYTPAGKFGIFVSKFLDSGPVYSGFNAGAVADVHVSELCYHDDSLDLLSIAKASIARTVIGTSKPLLRKNIYIECEPMFNRYRDFIGVHIGGLGSVGYSISRQYPGKNILELIDGLLTKGFKVVLTGDENDADRFRKHSAALQNSTGVENLAGKLDIRELACVLKLLKYYITPDNGTLHLAQAVGCKKILAIIGPTSPDLVRGANTEIIRLDLPCSPCLKFIEFPDRCVNPDGQICLSLLRPEKILDSIGRLS